MTRTFLLIAFVLLQYAAYCHDFNGMSTHIVIGKPRVTVILRMANPDLSLLSPATDSNRDGTISVSEFTSSSDNLTSDVAVRFLVNNNGQAVTHGEGASHIVSTDPVTSRPHEIAVSLIYRLPDSRDFEKLHVNPNLFRVIEDKPISYLTPPQGSQVNRVTIIDCDVVNIEAKGSEVYDTIVGKCE